MDVSLVMITLDGRHRAFPLRRRRMVVGRSRDCDLRIALPCVARHHCELEVDATGAVRVRDLGSANGTWRNGERVAVARLRPGDHLAVGPIVLTLVIDGQPGRVAPPSETHVRPQAVVATADG
ncbi:MAG: FHA domain-containing protein [Phycisphaeraceae bacterium]